MLRFYCIVIAGLVVTDVRAHWNYQNQDDWIHESETCGIGTIQSPISLSSTHAELVDYSSLTWDGYGQSVTAIVQNTGHTVRVTPNYNQSSSPEIYGDGLSERYKFDHLHFHWNCEHTVNGNRYPLEMHMVQYSDKYSSFDEAIKYSNNSAVAVFTVLFHVSPDDFEELTPLLDAVLDVQGQVNHIRILDNFVIKHYLPKDLAGYYRYTGSLTTPPCSEGVVWTVFEHTLPVSEAQVEVFKHIHSLDDSLLQENFRRLQPINDRPIMLRPSVSLRYKDNIANNSTMLAVSNLIFLFIYLAHCVYR